MILGRLVDITQRLARIDDKVRGGPIEADEWNELVTAMNSLVDILRDQDLGRNTALEAKFATADHQHLSEVSDTWLEPGLIEGLKTGGSTALQKSLASLSRRLDAFAEELAKVRELAETQRREVDRFSVSNFDFRGELDTLSDRFTEFDGLRVSLDGIDGRLNDIRGNLDLVNEISTRLTDPQGNPIDIAALSREVSDLGELRGALAGVDGDLVRLRDFELRLREVEGLARLDGDGDGLDERFAGLRADLNTSIDDRFATAEAARQTELATELGSRFAQLQTEREGIFETFSRTQNAQMESLGAEIETRIGATIAPTVSDATGSLGETLRTDLNDRFDAQRQELNTQIMAAARTAVAPLGTEISAQVLNTVEQQLDTRFAAIDRSIDSRLAPVDAAVAGIDRQVTTAVTDAIRDEREALDLQISTEVRAQTTGLQDEISSSLRAEIVATIAEETSDLPGLIDRRVDERFVDVDRRVDRLIDERLSDLDLRVTRAVDTAVAAENLDQRFTDQAATLQRDLTAGLAQTESRLRAEQTTLLNQNVTTLRSEIDRARETAVREANELRLNDTNTITRRPVTPTDQPVSPTNPRVRPR